MRAAVVVGQEEEDTTVRFGAPGLDAGAADRRLTGGEKGDQKTVLMRPSSTQTPMSTWGRVP